jgi:hypothetical protein
MVDPRRTMSSAIVSNESDGVGDSACSATDALIAADHRRDERALRRSVVHDRTVAQSRRLIVRGNPSSHASDPRIAPDGFANRECKSFRRRFRLGLLESPIRVTGDCFVPSCVCLASSVVAISSAQQSVGMAQQHDRLHPLYDRRITRDDHRRMLYGRRCHAIPSSIILPDAALVEFRAVPVPMVPTCW